MGRTGMFSLRRPAEAEVAEFIARQAELDFSYREVGATQHALPAGYDSDHSRAELGTGEAAFTAAKAAFLRWEHFRTDWTTVFWPHTPVEPGQTVAVIAQALGLWSLNACRIVYVVDDPIHEERPVTRFGFGYGTLPGHIESGEERFLIEWDRQSDRVSYHVVVDLDVDHVRVAADRAVLDILLHRAGREVERDHDLLAARVADVGGIVLHCFLLPANSVGSYLADLSRILPAGCWGR